MYLVGIRRLRQENQCASCQEFWENAFPERMRIFVDETYQPSCIAFSQQRT